jgi:hypothetical protein
MDGTQIHTIRAHTAKNHALATTRLTALANRSNLVNGFSSEIIGIALSEHRQTVAFPESVDDVDALLTESGDSRLHIGGREPAPTLPGINHSLLNGFVGLQG